MDACKRLTGRNQVSSVSMWSIELLRRPSGFLPVVMSVVALATIILYLLLHGSGPQADEVAAAHVWQFLMVCQVPVMIIFAVTWLPRSPRQAVTTLAIQLAAAAIAIAPVIWLQW